MHLRFMIAKEKTLTRTDTKRVSEKYGLDNFTIHRAALHQVLLSYIDPSAIQTNKRLADVAEYGSSLLLKFQDGTMYQADYLIAADGIHSVVRQKLLPHSKPSYAGYTCWRGVVTDPSIVLEEAAEYWGKGCRFGVVPLADNQVYWFACVNAPQKDERMKNLSQASLLHTIQRFSRILYQHSYRKRHAEKCCGMISWILSPFINMLSTIS